MLGKWNVMVFTQQLVKTDLSVGQWGWGGQQQESRADKALMLGRVWVKPVNCTEMRHLVKSFFVIMKHECVALYRVMAQVSCELVAPKESRPNEGIMFFNIELSPMASPTFEQGRWERTLCSSVPIHPTDNVQRIPSGSLLITSWIAVGGRVGAGLRLRCLTFSQTACAVSVNHPWGFLALQAVWVVSEAKQTAGEMLEEFQVHWYRVPVCVCLRSGVADQSGRTHVESWREPDGCCQHCCHHRSVPLQAAWCRHPGRRSHRGESAADSRWCFLLHWIYWEMLWAPGCSVVRVSVMTLGVYNEGTFLLNL